MEGRWPTGPVMQQMQCCIRRAVSLQDALPYTEPPFWYYPTLNLGAALLK